MKINGLDFTIGADPEFFVANKMGKPVSAYGMIPGTKKEPLKVPRGAVQVDGMALEFNIDPAATQDEFVHNLDAVLDTILAMVPGYTMFQSPVAEFGFDYIQRQPEEAKMLGCDPDFNAYTKDANPRPDGATPFRTASGHVHIGWTNGVDPHDPGHFEACCTLSKMLDLRLGVPSLIWDQDRKRRQLYGQAGCFRPKSYGMEYRVLSNAWLNPKFPHIRKFVFGETVRAVNDLFDKEEAWDVKISGMSPKDILSLDDKEKEVSIINHATQISKVIKTPRDYREAA
jgi:hypothetical protein